MSVSREFNQALLAWQFLTRVPLPAALAARIDAEVIEAARAADAGAGGTSGLPAVSVRYFATVGLVIGAFAALVWSLAALIWPAAVAIVIAVGATVWLTGAFHEDGLADTCDALIGHVSRARAFAIMRDSRIGTYGACGLWVVLTGRVVLLSALPASLVPWAFIIGQGASRAAAMTMMYRLPYVADPESSKLVSRMAPCRASDIAIGWVSVGLVVMLSVIVTRFADSGVSGSTAFAAWLLALLAVGLGLWGLSRWFLARLGGYSGDCLGATQQVTELLCLAGLLAVAGGAAP